MLENKIKQMIGDLVVANLQLQTQVETLQKELEELKKKEIE